MSLYLFNSLTQKKEIFKPLKKGEVKIYVCGPTVYGRIHIGNARTFLFFDILKRYLKWCGFKVIYVSNITDVGHLTDEKEDKIMKGAAEAGLPVKVFIEEHIKNYLADLDYLNIERPDIMPRASEHIKEIIETVKTLLKKGYAYEIEELPGSKSVYFDISKFKSYGKLSRQRLSQLINKTREPPNEKKRNPGDFALWIAAEKTYPLVWKSPWGFGFPGWHIECSTMSGKYLGIPFDIHGGGIDLIFPHHENEIAQAEAATGKKFVNYWIHCEHLLVNMKKMSKSLGNIYTLEDIISRGYNPLALRFLVLSSHYQSKLNFTWKSLEAASNSLENIYEFLEKLLQLAPTKLTEKLPPKSAELETKVKETKKRIKEAMNDNLSTPEVLSALFELMDFTTSLLSKKLVDISSVYQLFLDVDQFLGLRFKETIEEELAEEILELIKKREEFRLAKNFRDADRIRNRLKEMGIEIEDTPYGPIWKRTKRIPIWER